MQIVTQESETDNGEVAVDIMTRQGIIHADLKIGANVAGAKRLLANDLLSNRGVIPHGAGFIVTPEEARDLGLGSVPGLEQHIRPYRNGRDLTGTARGVLVIDLFELQVEEVRRRFPAVYQWLLERVKPERDQNNRKRVRELWWLFAEARVVMRRSLKGLRRYIVTGQVAKHRVFQWLDASILPDDKLITVASADALHLGVLSSSIHGTWALATGGLLEDRPVYSKSTCFETFPFPEIDSSGSVAEDIRNLAEQIDSHRKTRIAIYPEVTITATYNILEKLRNDEPLTAKEKEIYQHGLVGVLKSLHDDLDKTVLEAYGWSDLDLPADNDLLLERLVDLNAKRASEEASGLVRWLRPEFQKANEPEQIALETEMDIDENISTSKTKRTAIAQRPWPIGLIAQIKLVSEVLTSAGQSLDLEDLAAHFSGRGRWRDRLPTLMDTLVAFGRARVLENGHWLAAAG